MKYDDIKVKCDEPYPEIVDAENSPHTVSILKNLASGRSGEFTAISQYTYQHIVSNSHEEDVAKILEEIGIVEMRHLEMLSSAIVSFGGKPVFQDGRGQYFTTSYANYTTNLKEMLKSNVRMESGAVTDYEQAAQRVNNESLKQLLLRIRDDERLHLKVFKHLLESVEFFGK